MKDNLAVQIEAIRQEAYNKIKHLLGLDSDVVVEVVVNDCDNEAPLAISARANSWRACRHDDQAWYTSPPQNEVEYNGEVSIYVE